MPSSRTGRPLSIAVYGYVDHRAGGLATANHRIVDHLLGRGHRIDFYAIGGFVQPEGFEGRENYRYIPVTIRPLKAGWPLVEHLPGALRRIGSFGYSQISTEGHERAISRRIRAEHRKQAYDALVVLGTLSGFRVPGLPCLSWTQGPPQTEWEAIQALRGQFVTYGGKGLYRGLALLYRLRQSMSRRRLSRSALIICGSQWAVGAWVRFGVPRSALRAIPYTYDLEKLRPGAQVGPTETVTFLWLGRIVPRKRLDLMLEAFKRLRAERPDVRLRIIGQFAYALGYRRLLDEYAGVEGIEYRPSIPHAEIPDLFREVDVVVQPSEAENLGSTVAEGLCFGVPAIVGPTNGTKDYLGDSSIVFDRYDPDSLKDAMNRMVEALGADRDRLAAEARAAAERYFEVETVVDQLESAIVDMISSRS